jgi:hypothetical protein
MEWGLLFRNRAGISTFASDGPPNPLASALSLQIGSAYTCIMQDATFAVHQASTGSGSCTHVQWVLFTACAAFQSTCSFRPLRLSVGLHNVSFPRQDCKVGTEFLHLMPALLATLLDASEEQPP